jgi:hypothetical protein
MLNPISVTSPTLHGESTVNVIMVLIWFVSTLVISTWFMHKVWSD